MQKCGETDNLSNGKKNAQKITRLNMFSYANENLFFASRRLYSQYDPPFDLEDSSSLPTKYISTQQHADAMGGKPAVEHIPPRSRM